MAEAVEPPIKKKKIENLELCIEKIIHSETNLTPILSDEINNPIPLKKCYAGHIKDAKLISNAIKVLNEKLPLIELQHLKRVNKHSVLLCPLDQLNKTFSHSIQDYVELHVPELRDMFDYCKEVEVPSLPPLTKKQSIECNKKWSCNFHPNKYIEKMLSSHSCFRQTELQMHRTFMGMAFQLAKISLSKNNYMPCIQDLNSYDINAAIVVDPINKSVVAIAIDNRKEHPIQHAAMLAIDNVAKTQNGGAWTTNEDLLKDAIWKLRHKFNQVTFGARQYVSKKDAIDSDKVDDSPYLCTGYDIYLIREPCVMCAMGLVHARIKRVFYTYENNIRGALRSKTKLHCVKSLNHRFEVFTGFDK